VDHKDGVVHLSSSDGARLEIPEAKLSPEDINYLRSQDGHVKAPKRVGFVRKLLRAFRKKE
jgi:hypothetical protein